MAGIEARLSNVALAERREAGDKLLSKVSARRPRGGLGRCMVLRA